MFATDAITLKVTQASEVLQKLRFDRAGTSERSALTLLALLGLTPTMPWSQATNPMLRTRAIMDHMAEHYNKAYAPNTRETIRKQSIEPFMDAAFVVENPDEPTRPITSPKWCYQISSPALKLLRTVDQPGFESRLADYLAELPGLLDIYARARQLHRIPVALPDGRAITLSPGGQNILLKQMIEEFCPQFTPGGQVLYIGDADEKYAVFAGEELRQLRISLPERGKMPDLVVHMIERNWLILLEAVSSQGPVDAKRRGELQTLFAGSTAGLIYVSCFSSRSKMREFLPQLAWETEVWCADDPAHLIHFDGERFLGPYQ